MDPDYEKNNKAIRIKEEKDKEENKLTNEKVTQIINEIFDEELLGREKQLEELEDKVFKAQKLLHLVRYVLITSYYQKSSLEVPPEEDTTIGFDKQNRIHPAVKKLLGSNPSLDVFCSGKGKRRVAAKNCDKINLKSQTPEAKRAKLENKSETTRNNVDSEQNFLKNRKKTRHRLVIGNVSKWVHSPEDNTTHKWMVYVRGAKDTPDISHIVEKVIFYLHPSYKPHDVVEVRQSPFHLSRRGWGEFPLRVQVFFKCPLNKPVSIVHNLKLENTFTGRQTLGNETLVDVYLHDYKSEIKSETITKPSDEVVTEESSSMDDIFTTFNASQQMKTSVGSDNTHLVNMKIKDEPLDYEHLDSKLRLEDLKCEPPDINADPMSSNVDVISSRSDSAYGCSDTASMSFEHDYCDVVEEQLIDNEVEMKDQFLNYFILEHSYCTLSNAENEVADSPNQLVTSGSNKVSNGDVNNKLIFGLGDNYLKQGIPKVHNVVPKKLTVVQKRSLNGYVDGRGALHAKFGIVLPQNRFKNVGEALPYILKRFTLWNDEIKSNSGFKILYPFIASSKEEFQQWPVAKKLNSEWNRARTIKNILAERFPSLKRWSTRAIFMYARSHKYSPVLSSGRFFKSKSEDLMLINHCFSEVEKNAINIDKNREIDVSVDIEAYGDNSTTPISRKTTYIDISDNSLKNHCAFVRETALNSGVILRSEEISDGVIMNGAERLMLEAVKCLAENLIRRANHHLTCRKDYRDGSSEITTSEITVALNERSDIQYIREFGAKLREEEFFS